MYFPIRCTIERRASVIGRVVVRLLRVVNVRGVEHQPTGDANKLPRESPNLRRAPRRVGLRPGARGSSSRQAMMRPTRRARLAPIVLTEYPP